VGGKLDRGAAYDTETKRNSVSLATSEFRVRSSRSPEHPDVEDWDFAPGQLTSRLGSSHKNRFTVFKCTGNGE
jgi:hypothetical protein